MTTETRLGIYYGTGYPTVWGMSAVVIANRPWPGRCVAQFTNLEVAGYLGYGWHSCDMADFELTPPIDGDAEDAEDDPPPVSYAAPEPGEWWLHRRNHIPYEIKVIANVPQTILHQTQVVYRGRNGLWWSRPLADWHDHFDRLPDFTTKTE